MAAGYRGHIAPWVGGLSSPTAAVSASGRRSHLFFWIGGLSAPVVTQEPEAPAGGGGSSSHWHAMRRQRIHNQNQAILAALAALAASGALQ